jgi:hypothetical protein
MQILGRVTFKDTLNGCPGLGGVRRHNEWMSWVGWRSETQWMEVLGWVTFEDTWNETPSLCHVRRHIEWKSWVGWCSKTHGTKLLGLTFEHTLNGSSGSGDVRNLTRKIGAFTYISQSGCAQQKTIQNQHFHTRWPTPLLRLSPGPLGLEGAHIAQAIRFIVSLRLNPQTSYPGRLWLSSGIPKTWEGG